MIIGSIYQEDKYTNKHHHQQKKVAKYVKQNKELKGEIYKHTVIVGGFNTFSQQLIEQIDRKSLRI